MKAKTVTAQIVGAKREEAARLKAIRDGEAAAILEEQKTVDEAAALKKKTEDEALKIENEQKIIDDQLKKDAEAIKKKL